MIKTCQLVFSLPFLASLLPQVDHGHRGSPCYCYCIVTVNNSNSVIFIVIVLVIVIVIVIVRATIIVIYVLAIRLMILKREKWNSHLKWIARSMKVMPLSSNSGVSI